MVFALRCAALSLALLCVSAAADAAETFVYVHSRNTAEIFGFALDEKSGELSALPGSPFGTGNGTDTCRGYCQSLAYSKRGRALVAPGGDSIASLVVATDGTLSPAPNSPWTVPGRQIGAASALNGKYVYVSNLTPDEIGGFAVEKNGDLVEVPGSPFDAGSLGPIGLSSAKKLLVVANQPSGTLSAFLIGKGGSLSLGPNSPFDTGAGDVFNVDIDPKGKFAYFGDCDSNEIRGYALDKKSASLSELEGSPFATDLQSTCSGLAMTRRGAIAVEWDDEVQVFTRNKDGSLEAMGEPQAATLGTSHALNRNGKLLVLTDEEAATVTSYAFDMKTGALSELDSASIAGADSAGGTVVIKR